MCDSTGINNSGFTSYTTFSTLAPCPDPNNLALSNITDNSVLLSWTGTTAAAEYTLLYRLDGAANWDTTVVSNTYSGTAVTYTLSGLSAGTMYEWSLSTTCIASGVSSTVNGSDFTTLLACIVPSGMGVTNILLDRATMNWTATSNAHHYDVRLRSSGGSWLYMNYIFGTSKTKYGLTSGTSYEWQLRGVCSADTSVVSAWTSIQTFSTLAPCSKPINTNVTAITTTEGMLGWDVVSSATAYDVRFKLQGSSWGSWQYTFGVTPNQLLMDNLNLGTWYHWQVRAVCGSSDNMSGFTSYNTFQTLSSNRITAGDIQLGENLNIYPNPTRGLFNISFIAAKVDNFEIAIIDAFGKLVFQEDKQDFIGEYTKQVDLSDFPRGIYMLQIRNQNSFVSKRIVLQ
jgi:hypothetical protein